MVVAGPAIAVRKFVTANLSLNGRRDPPADPWNHEKTSSLMKLRAAQGAIRRHNTVHRVAIVLDLRHRALLHGQPSAISVIVKRWWRINRMDWMLRSVHGARSHGSKTAVADQFLEAVVRRHLNRSYFPGKLSFTPPTCLLRG